MDPSTPELSGPALRQGAVNQAAAEIRPFDESDWPELWRLLARTFAAGDTYAFAPDITEAEAHQAWIDLPRASFIARDANGHLLGTYFLKPNQPGLGAHVCNCGYIVDAASRGQGVAAAMCEHSQRQAVAMGFRAMQFNLVVATNTRAIELWRRLGFAVVGTLPGAFRQLDRGYVDALIMYKTLAS